MVTSKSLRRSHLEENMQYNYLEKCYFWNCILCTSISSGFGCLEVFLQLNNIATITYWNMLYSINIQNTSLIQQKECFLILHKLQVVLFLDFFWATFKHYLIKMKMVFWGLHEKELQ